MHTDTPHPLRALLDVLLPDACPGCGADRGAGPLGLCRDCAPVVRGLPVPVPVGSPLRGAWALGHHDGPLGAAVRRAKYRPDPLLVDALGDALGDALAGRTPRVDVVVSVPVHRSRRLRRGLDQGERLGRRVAARVGVPHARALRRVSRGDQAGRRGDARRTALRGAFRGRDPGGARVLLVDDVCTTGTTAQLCARELLGAGAHAVWLATVTHAGTQP
jgi:predicted amidophosphoribosyltransferase